MSKRINLQPQLREKAENILKGVSSQDRETLLIKCWMSHDARWFMAVAKQFGIDSANRLNKIAAHAIGEVEAQRIPRALNLSKPATIDDCLLLQEIFISLLGPDLMDYTLIKIDDHTYQVRASRCFAHENALRAGIAEDYECGIFARTTGWLEALGVSYKTDPALGKCPKAQGRECSYTFNLTLPNAVLENATEKKEGK